MLPTQQFNILIVLLFHKLCMQSVYVKLSYMEPVGVSSRNQVQAYKLRCLNLIFCLIFNHPKTNLY